MCSLLSRKLLNISRFLYKTSYIKSCEIVTLSRNLRQQRLYSTEVNNKFPEDYKDELNEAPELAPDIKAGYKAFRDEDAEIILDVDEERRKIDMEKINALDSEADRFADLNLKRGITGVFEVDELVEILKKEKAFDVFVVAVPPEFTYVNYLVIVSGKSQRHMTALATYVRKAFKLKKHVYDRVPKIEGENHKQWIAIDLGNIALHIFSTIGREKYDLETLWSVGQDYDKTNEEIEDEFHDKYKAFLAALQPNEHRSRSARIINP